MRGDGLASGDQQVPQVPVAVELHGMYRDDFEDGILVDLLAQIFAQRDHIELERIAQPAIGYLAQVCFSHGRREALQALTVRAEMNRRANGRRR